MQEQPQRPRRPRGRRRPARRDRPTRAPAEPRPPSDVARPPADRPRVDRGRGGRGRPERGRPERGRPAPARGRDRRPRRPVEEDVGQAAVILLDNREGEPDLTGSPAVFEGYFDLETGERRRAGQGVPRLRAGNDRLWGFECWWRPDPAGAGLTPEDHELVETSKRLLRGLLRDARRAGRSVRP